MSQYLLSVDPDIACSEQIERVCRLRNSRISHLEEKVQMGDLPKIGPTIANLREIARAFGKIFNALSFEGDHEFLLHDLLECLKRDLDRIALDSDFSKVHDENYRAWSNFIMPQLLTRFSSDDAKALLDDLNERRGRAGRCRLLWQ